MESAALHRDGAVQRCCEWSMLSSELEWPRRVRPDSSLSLPATQLTVVTVTSTHCSACAQSLCGVCQRVAVRCRGQQTTESTAKHGREHLSGRKSGPTSAFSAMSGCESSQPA